MENQIDEFEGLLMDYFKGNITPEEIHRLVVLLKNNTSLQEKYSEMARMYGVVSSPWFEQRKQLNLERLRDKLNFTTSRRNTLHRRIRIWGNAAVWILAVSCTIFSFYYRNHSIDVPYQPSYCQIEIPKGGTSKLLLPDSTRVVLNGGSTIRYDASFLHQKERKVFLTGEAYFEVAKNQAKPFIVRTADLNVQVLGTTFNVASYIEDPEVRVSLVEGKVNVFTDSSMNHPLSLSPNEQAVYCKQSKQLFMKKIDVRPQVAWTTGKMVFVNETLSNILQYIGKKYGVTILIKTRRVYDEYYSGSIDAKLALEEVLSYIDMDKKFVWTRSGSTIMIIDR